MAKPVLLLTCEHGGNKIPAAYSSLFRGQQKLLASHRGWDIGALALAKIIAKDLDVGFFYTDISRLLIETNRSLHHPKLFSEFTQTLSNEEKNQLIHKFYLPHRLEVESYIKKLISRRQQVLHIAAHSFTPSLQGQLRQTDIGLLYDPRRAGEKQFCDLWKRKIEQQSDDFRVRKNYPYRGNSDCLAVQMRKLFSESEYIGIELETNNKHLQDKKNIDKLADIFVNSLR